MDGLRGILRLVELGGIYKLLRRCAVGSEESCEILSAEALLSKQGGKVGCRIEDVG